MTFSHRYKLICDLGFGQDKLEKLDRYILLLWQSNEELNLISRKMTFEDLIDNHVVDCLLPMKLLTSRIEKRNVKNIADFGSGGGLPSVIYAIQYPEIQFHLFEKSNLKQDFLKKCSAIAPNIQVHGEIPKKLEKTDLITARAFKPIDVILELSRDYYKSGGEYFLLKGRREKIEEELVLSKKKFKEISVEIEQLHSPILEVERHIVSINKK